MAGLAHFALHGCQIVFRNPTDSGAATLIRRVGIPKRQSRVGLSTVHSGM